MSVTMSSENILSDNYCPYIVVERPILNRPRFDEMYKAEDEGEQRGICRQIADHCVCSRESVKKFIFSHIPCIAIMSEYNVKKDLIGDIIAGLVVGIVAIPQGMAYAMLAAVPPVYGLYGSFFPPLIYFIFGTSRHISLGTFALASLIVGNEVQKYDCSQAVDTMTTASFEPTTLSLVDANTTTSVLGNAAEEGYSPEQLCRINVAIIISLMGGIIQFLLGIFQMGFVSTYMSYPLTRAFTCGCSILVIGSQIKGLLRLELPSHSGPLSLFYMLSDLFPIIKESHVPTIIISAIAIVVLVLVKEFFEPWFKSKLKVPFPIELFVVIVATTVSYLVDLNKEYGVEIIEDVPTSMPAPSLPRFSDVNMVALLPSALSAGIVGYANAMSFGKMVAKTKGYEIDGNQELLAHGITNIVGSFFNSIISSATLSRSSLAVSAGAVTQVFSLVSCSLILCVMLFLGQLFEPLPGCVLSAIIVVALKNLMLQIRDLKALWSIDKVDFVIWVFTFVATIVLDVALGLFASILFVLMTIVFRAQNPPTTILGQVPDTEIYADVKSKTKTREIQGIKIFRFDSSLHFANIDQFVESLHSKTELIPQDIRKQKKRAAKLQAISNNDELSVEEDIQNIRRSRTDSTVSLDSLDEVAHTVILDCSMMAYIDSVGAGTLAETVKEYENLGINVHLAGCRDSVLHTMESAGFYNTANKKFMYLTVHDAVQDAVAANWGNYGISYASTKTLDVTI